YTPSQTSVAEVTPTASTDSKTVNVVYTIGAQKATINIIDETDGDKNLRNATETGDAGSAVNFNDADAALKNYLANGYA
ncbi:mucin-binding protein, partial [Enterococcus lactis]|uniref:mucin-binding protein n=1 Tax=Enterococcus lactis TaxID=357441 RepID=UPI0031CD02D3